MGFRGSDARIYAQQQIKGKNREWHEADVFRKLAKIASLGFRWDIERHVLKKDGPYMIGTETPWIHARGSHKVRCGFDHYIAFNEFGVISPKCLSCWKVCMGLPDFKSLMFMEEVQEQLPMDCPCKCGIEVRDYTPREYGAYFYNRSLEEGRDKYEFVKDLVEKHFENGKELAKDIILKRGCTEYEMIKGPSNYWHTSKKDEKIYELLDAYVEDRRSHVHQDATVKAYIRQNWILWAHSHGDFSYLPWNEEEKLFPSVVTYHEGDIEGIKKDLDTSIKMASGEKQTEVHTPVDMSTVEEYVSEVIGDLDETT